MSDVGSRPRRRNRFRLIRGKTRRTKRDHWFSRLPVLVWPLPGTFGLILRVGEDIYYLGVVRSERCR